MPNDFALGATSCGILPEADQPQHRSAQADEWERPPASPSARPARGHWQNGILRTTRKQQRHGVIGNFVEAIVRHLGDHDSACRWPRRCPRCRRRCRSGEMIRQRVICRIISAVILA